MPPLFNKGTATREKVMKAAGIESSAMRKPIQNAPVEGARRHDLMIMTNSDDPFKPRVNTSKGAATLRRANIKYQQGQLLQEVKSMDVVTAEPLGSEEGNKFNARAKIYEKMTKGASKSRIEPVSVDAKIGSMKIDGKT